MIEATISVQTLGIGVAAFVATMAAAFLFLNAAKETLARAFAYALVASAFWGWFGFFSAVAAEQANMDLARQLRLYSIMGNVFLAGYFLRFAFVYKRQTAPLTRSERIAYDANYFLIAAFTVLLFSDSLFGSRFVLGDFVFHAATPTPGPFFDPFVLYYCACIVGIYIVMMRRVRLETGPSRRGHIILVSSMVLGATAGVAGFMAWYQIYSPVFTAIRALAVPSLSFGAFWAMSSHNIFNFRVAAANVFVFAIWTFLFFRILLTPSFAASVPDLLLLASLILLGVLLIRSFNQELEARVLVEQSERERAIEQSKAEFISIAAHQLRTPLSGIRWTFSLLEEAEGLTKEQKDMVAKGSARTKDVVERVNEMLRAARLTDDSFALSFEPHDVRTTIKDSVALFKEAAAARGLTLESALPRKALTIQADKDKFAIVIQNLIDNAIKYTKTGGVRVSAEAKDSDIVIRIEDTGIGMSANDRAHLFEKFYRNERATKMFTDGSGLGLFIVKKIVDAHNGTIEAESKQGKGTSFIITIPSKNG